MMLYPAIGELEKVTKSRYALVIVTAKRARQLSEASEANKIQLEDKPVKLAIKDIASGKVTCKTPSSEEAEKVLETVETVDTVEEETEE